MANYNKVILIGNLVSDPQYREFKTGNTLTILRLAVKEKSDKSNTCFIDVKVWDKDLQKACEEFKKGELITVEGKIALERWMTKDGANRSQHVIIAHQLMKSMRQQETFESEAQTFQ